MHLRAKNGPYEGSEHPSFENPQRVAWAEEDEALYSHALLYAGAEPEIEYQGYEDGGYTEYYATGDSMAAHEAWQERLTEVLMTKYEKYWWFIPEANRTPEYRKRGATVYLSMKKDELKKFYTWLCKQRGEPWTHEINPR